MLMTDHLLSPSEAAKFLGVTPETVRIWTRKGKLPFVWVPRGKTRWRKLEMKTLIAFKEGSL